ncbi:hypothetical protein EMCRGX_G032784 [Ephydatia muelleri]
MRLLLPGPKGAKNNPPLMLLPIISRHGTHSEYHRLRTHYSQTHSQSSFPYGIFHHRHSAVNDIIHRALVTARVPSHLEPSDLYHSDGKQPDAASLSEGAAVEEAEVRKHRANDPKCSELGWVCIPLAVETYGNWGREAQSTFSRLASHLAIITSSHKINDPPYSSPYQCPRPKLETNNCSAPCTGRSQCCGSVCTQGVLPPKPCLMLVSKLSPVPRIGAYVPQCSSDGNFAPIQIWGSTGYSWCVDTSDGKPLTAAVPPGYQPNCTVCTEKGKIYYPGQFFQASDGCNTCYCTDTATSVCTQKPCIACPVQGQVYTSCGAPWDATCDSPTPHWIVHCVAKCQCPWGTVLDKKNKKCVLLRNCPSRGSYADCEYD